MQKQAGLFLVCKYSGNYKLPLMHRLKDIILSQYSF
jgi:hypothetical protein